MITLDQIEKELQFMVDMQALDEEVWKTINGAHVKVDTESNVITIGPKALKEASNKGKNESRRPDSVEERRKQYRAREKAKQEQYYAQKVREDLGLPEDATNSEVKTKILEKFDDAIAREERARERQQKIAWNTRLAEHKQRNAKMENLGLPSNASPEDVKKAERKQRVYLHSREGMESQGYEIKGTVNGKDIYMMKGTRQNYVVNSKGLESNGTGQRASFKTLREAKRFLENHPNY